MQVRCRCGRIVRYVPAYLADCAVWVCTRCSPRAAPVVVPDPPTLGKPKPPQKDYIPGQPREGYRMCQNPECKEPMLPATVEYFYQHSTKGNLDRLCKPCRRVEARERSRQRRLSDNKLPKMRFNVYDKETK